tara:strand:- start:16 stop:627 length:612 start_codon:yes stop_codon:yes gene_type:complete
MKTLLSITILLSLIFFKTAYSKELEAFCLITKADVKDARLDPKENERFAGKTIKLLLSFAKDNTEENLIVDLSDDNVVGLITGLYGGVEDIQTFKIEKDGIRYSSTFDAKDGEKTITYKYNNILRIPNNKPTSLFAIVDVKGFSMTTYRFQIDCKDKEYTDEEIISSKTEPTSDILRKLGIKDEDEFFKKVQEKLEYSGSKNK